jgi:2-keto-3-deoxy-L-rhamnonate aldolase RhmA
MYKDNEMRKSLKHKLRKRERLFAGWISYAHPSIAETFAYAGFDFIAIDMEHSTISLEQGQRIIAATQSLGVPCLPRPVSHSNDWIKPLLESGADGMIMQMVNTGEELKQICDHVKYPPEGNRSFGVNRAQNYGFTFDEYVKDWNDSSILIIQVESQKAVDNIEELLENPLVDGVMVGPYDISGSLGVPGQLEHPKVVEASRKVILACEKAGISCGTQLADVNEAGINRMFDLGYTYSILGSDLFVLWKWAAEMKALIKK